MPLPADLLGRKQTNFVLWLAKPPANAPVLVIGQFQPGNPPALANGKRFTLTAVAGLADLYAIAAGACGLTDGWVYHYWFEVDDSNPAHPPASRVLCSDPMGFAID